MSDYNNHSKFMYVNYDEIQSAINNNEINAWDMIICKDTKEFILVKEDLSLSPIKSKVYCFTNIESAEEQLNTMPETYAGQIVAILDTKRGNYNAYIVNQRSNGSYRVDPLNIYSENIDYDTLGNRPIANLYSDAFSPTVLDQQKEGIYRVSGAYKISDAIETIYDSYDSYIFLVHHDKDGTTYVKKVGNEITDYIINQNGEYSISITPTTDWIKAQGYVTESYVDTKIAALDLITREEITEYVSNVVLYAVNNIVDDRIEVFLNERFQTTTEQEIINIF